MTNRGYTHSYEGTTQSVDIYLENKRKYNPTFGTFGTNSIYEDFRGTYSRWGTQSHPFEAHVNRQKKFYIKPNSETKYYPATNLSNFIIEMTGLTESRVDDIITSANVTVDGNLVIDINYQLIQGQIVRVGDGHINNNSRNIAIVGTASIG